MRDYIFCNVCHRKNREMRGDKVRPLKVIKETKHLLEMNWDVDPGLKIVFLCNVCASELDIKEGMWANGPEAI